MRSELAHAQLSNLDAICLPQVKIAPEARPAIALTQPATLVRESSANQGVEVAASDKFMRNPRLSSLLEVFAINTGSRASMRKQQQLQTDRLINDAVSSSPADVSLIENFGPPRSSPQISTGKVIANDDKSQMAAVQKRKQIIAEYLEMQSKMMDAMENRLGVLAKLMGRMDDMASKV